MTAVLTQGMLHYASRFLATLRMLETIMLCLRYVIRITTLKLLTTDAQNEAKPNFNNVATTKANIVQRKTGP
jgi:hypothetical protein